MKLSVLAFYITLQSQTNCVFHKKWYDFRYFENLHRTSCIDEVAFDYKVILAFAVIPFWSYFWKIVICFEHLK